MEISAGLRKASETLSNINFTGVTQGECAVDAYVEEHKPLGPPAPSENTGIPFPMPEDEAGRLETLRKFQVMDTDADFSFDNITQLASTIFGMPICLVSLLDGKRQWFKSKHGLDAESTPRDQALCNYVISEKTQDVVVLHPLDDERTKNNPLVLSIPIGHYAGAALKVGNHRIGTLCMLDYKRHPDWTEENKEKLRRMAACVVDLLWLHKRRMDDVQRKKQLGMEKNVLLSSISAISQGTLIVDANSPDYPVAFINKGVKRLFGLKEEEIIGKPLRDVITHSGTNQDDLDKLLCAINFRTRQVVTMECEKRTLLSQTSNTPPQKFWAKFSVVSLNQLVDDEIPLPGETPAPKRDLPKALIAAEKGNTQELSQYVLLEIANGTERMMADQEAEKLQKEAIFAMESRKALMVNLSREFRGKLDIIIQASTYVMSNQSLPYEYRVALQASLEQALSLNAISSMMGEQQFEQGEEDGEWNDVATKNNNRIPHIPAPAPGAYDGLPPLNEPQPLTSNYGAKRDFDTAGFDDGNGSYMAKQHKTA